MSWIVRNVCGSTLQLMGENGIEVILYPMSEIDADEAFGSRALAETCLRASLSNGFVVTASKSEEVKIQGPELVERMDQWYMYLAPNMSRNGKTVAAKNNAYFCARRVIRNLAIGEQGCVTDSGYTYYFSGEEGMEFQVEDWFVKQSMRPCDHPSAERWDVI